MSKTNIYTLVATALLGVLLFVVVQFTRRVPTEPVVTNIVTEPAGLQIGGRADLAAFLESRQFDVARAIGDSIAWRRARGFFDSDRFFGTGEGDVSVPDYDSIDIATLESMSDTGDLAATQALAARILLEDPFTSLGLYATAANQGSTYAVIQIGGLRETFSDITLDKFISDPEYQQNLNELRGDGSINKLKIEAFAYIAAAIRDGGIAIVDRELLDWIQRLEYELRPEEQVSACAMSENIFLKFSSARRSRGLAQITTEPPPVFFGIPDLEAQLPCQSSGHSIIWLLDLSRCSASPVSHANGEVLDLYICQN